MKGWCPHVQVQNKDSDFIKTRIQDIYILYNTRYQDTDILYQPAIFLSLHHAEL